MSVVSSSYVLGPQEVDGRRYVRETHTLSTGAVIVQAYGPVPSVDYDEVLSFHAREIADGLADIEAQGVIQ